MRRATVCGSTKSKRRPRPTARREGSYRRHTEEPTATESRRRSTEKLPPIVVADSSRGPDVPPGRRNKLFVGFPSQSPWDPLPPVKMPGKGESELGRGEVADLRLKPKTTRHDGGRHGSASIKSTSAPKSMRRSWGPRSRHWIVEYRSMQSASESKLGRKDNVVLSRTVRRTSSRPHRNSATIALR